MLTVADIDTDTGSALACDGLIGHYGKELWKPCYWQTFRQSTATIVSGRMNEPLDDYLRKHRFVQDSPRID